MNDFKVGFASANINPELGMPVAGYFVPRYAKGFLDDLTTSVLALSCKDTTVLMISTDTCEMERSVVEDIAHEVSKATGIAEDNLFISSTHTHTSPVTQWSDMFPMDPEQIKKYTAFLALQTAKAAQLALADRKPAAMGYAVGKAPDRIAYIRRYKMKDGSVMTCPPINDPNIDHPIGTLDQRVNVLRFDREGGSSIVILNYGIHTDTIGGELISADWVHWTKKTLRDALDGTECMCFMGAQGDVGSTNVFPTKSDMNDTEISFDNEMKSPGMARFVGRALAGTVLQVYDKVEYVDVDEITMIQKVLQVPANVPAKEELPLAHKYKELHEAGRDDLIPFEAMELTTVVAEALRMCRLEHGPDHFDLPLSGIKIGNIAFIGIPGEPFTDIGVRIKETEGWDLICPSALTNCSQDYFPSESAFDEGGYEARSSSFVRTISSDIVNCAKEILSELKHEL